MNRRTWVVRGMLGGLGWVLLGVCSAQAGVIPPTVAATLMLSTDTSVTVSLYQLDSDLPSTLTLQSPSRCTSAGTSPLGTSSYKDVTDCWLPEWSPATQGKKVFVVVNGAADVPALVGPAATPAFPLPAGAVNPFLTTLTTSAYPGQCTNFGSGTGPDFQLGPARTLDSSVSPAVVGYELIPADCGGIAVIQVGARRFILPKDGTTTVAANGLPEVWESLHGGNLNPAADIDTGPVATSPCCDGITTFDEYRGFIVSGRQVRTDPKQKDLFVHLVNPADSVGGNFVISDTCGTSCYGGGTTTYPVPTAPSAALTMPGSAGTPGAIVTFTMSAPGVFTTAHVRGEITGNAGGRARIVAVTGPTSATAEITQAFPSTSLAPGAWRVSESVFALVYTLVAPERLHLLGYTPGATNFRTDEWVDNFVGLIPPQTLNISDTVTDRTVNANRVYGQRQKGIRVMEGLNLDATSLLGWSYGVASPNEAGNVVVFAQRIINYVGSLFTGATTLRFATASLVNGAWTWSAPTLAPDGDPAVTQDGVATNQGVRDFILSKAFQFYTGHEIHHSLDLTPGVQGTNRTTYGHHFAPGTGDCLDQAITVTTKSGTVTFNIPSLCGIADQAQFVIP